MTEVLRHHLMQGVGTRRVGADGGPVIQERGKVVLFTSTGDAVSSRENVFDAAK